MFGRSLISLLAVSVLAVQTVTATRYDGVFTVQHKNGGYLAPNAPKDATFVKVDPSKTEPDDYTYWSFDNTKPAVVIRFIPPVWGPAMYLDPKTPVGAPVGFSTALTSWKIQKSHNGTVTISSDGLFMSRALNDSVVLLPRKKAVGDAPLWQLTPLPI
ncbi:hypothetical protein B0O80DRAFT_155421 [Mortierella sp. GBAus27b]|nr:hypothetical protein B0O80DRAFT_155421 [Mortierella sp. GBAus27b]